MLPSQICFDVLNTVLEPQGIRQDHVIMARTVDENDRVTGAHFGESKIGGDVEDAIVLFPDPMGATGSSSQKPSRIIKRKCRERPSKSLP